MSSARYSRNRQRGVALMALLALLVLGASWWLLSSAGMGFNSRSAADRQHNAKVLSLAKQALIGYVAHRVNHPANPLADREAHPGRLPCPEADGNIGTANEGVAASVCSLPAVGRLPWRTLGLDQLRDASNEPLWYVVSEGWTLPSPNPIPPLALNSNTRGQLTVDGQANAAAALLIAPGAALPVQNSADCAGGMQTRGAPAPGIALSAYLECQNATDPPDATFATAGPSGSFNDQVLAVSAADIWSVVEGAVATRLVRDVMPRLQAALNAPYTDPLQWGGSAGPSTPMLPFALSFADDSTQPYQGGLPLWRSEGCVAGTDALCDPNFVYWAINDPDQASYPNPGIVKRNSGANSAPISNVNCAGSSAGEVRCTVQYGGMCGGGLNVGYILGGSCRMDLEISVLARAKNVGRALRTFTRTPILVNGSPPSVAGPLPSLVSHATPLDSLGSAAADIRVDLPPASCACLPVLCLLFPCNASNTATVRVPIAVFEDHPALTELFTTNTDWEWFIENKWYEAIYYGVAPSHAPGGAPHDCRSVADCLTVSGGSLPSDVRALVGMTGYSLGNLARPNANITDYLDSTQNRDGDPAFEQKRAGRSFNDRFFAVSAY